jgi:hypothetical protein
MGNRYGADGLTFTSKIDTSCGKIEISSTPLDEDDDDEPVKKNSNKFDEFDDEEKDELRQKFFKTSLSDNP